jgi:hypothetical protein
VIKATFPARRYLSIYIINLLGHLLVRFYFPHIVAKLESFC